MCVQKRALRAKGFNPFISTHSYSYILFIPLVNLRTQKKEYTQKQPKNGFKGRGKYPKLLGWCVRSAGIGVTGGLMEGAGGDGGVGK